MQKKWEFESPFTAKEKENLRLLAAELKCPIVVAELLYKNNMTDKEQLENYFNPCLNTLHDPYLFKDMEKAVKRIIQAIDTGEKITIYGDYDVDGATATALLYLGLKELNAVVEYYIPHRILDGYGLSISCLEYLHNNGTSLIITVDCGIIASDEIDTIKSLGMEIIITDHHNSKAKLPDAYAILNPKIEYSTYPFKDLAGVGVAYKLMMAIQNSVLNSRLQSDYPDNNQPQFSAKSNVQTIINNTCESNKTKYLDMVALGTIADIVSLTDENRVFATIGMTHLAMRKNAGLNALMNLAGIVNKAPDVNDIMFSLAPRLNAAGRMGSAMRAVELLITDDESKCKELAEIIERENSIRQQIDSKTYEEANEIINKKYKNMNETYCIVIYSDNWHPGVIGIVASKLIEKYYRPTIMISANEGIGSGSGRSIANLDLFKALEDAEDLLISFGGHKYAVGLTIMPEYIEPFEKKLSDYIKKNIDLKDLKPPLKINKKLELYEITYKLMDWLGKFAPYGVNNTMPVFYTENVMVHGYPYNVGKNHLKLKVKKDGCELDLIGFNLGDFLPLLKNNSRLDIAYTLDLATWQGKTSIQGNLKDLQLYD